MQLVNIYNAHREYFTFSQVSIVQDPTDFPRLHIITFCCPIGRERQVRSESMHLQNKPFFLCSQHFNIYNPCATI